MALRDPRTANRILLVFVLVLLVAVGALFLYARGLRSDLDELSNKAGRGPKKSAPAPGRGASDVEKDLEELRECFNKALQNTFEDFYRYVFGGETPPAPDQIVETCGSLSTKAEAKVYKRGLEFPVDMAWDGGDRIFFTEKATGNVRVLDGRRLADEPCVKLEVNSLGERGTLGIALDPAFEDNGYLYVYYTNASPLENRVTRFTVDDAACTQPEHIVTGIPATEAARHNGGQLEIIDDKLFVSVGDGYDDPSVAQDPASLLGKVLRYNLDGSIPEDNPFSDGGDAAAAWTIGHRNPFGLAHNPKTGVLYEAENGPECDDELNMIVKGANFGWGSGYSCGTNGVGDDPQKPLVRWSEPVVPTDPWFYEGATESLSGHLYLGEFGSGKLHRFTLNEAGDDVVADDVIYDSPSQIVDVSEGPGELLYFLTVDGIYRFET